MGCEKCGGPVRDESQYCEYCKPIRELVEEDKRIVNLAKDSKEVLKAHTDLMRLHFKALGCHCEVMGMMSENMLSACEGTPPMFGILHFREVLCRWGMTNEKGEPLI